MQKQPETKMIPLNKIMADKDQPRRNFDAARLADLMASIKEHGIRAPLIVEAFPDGTYLLEDGERRYRAAKELGLKEVPAYITEPKKSIERLVMQFHLQEQHQGWSALEKASAVSRLAKELGMSAVQIGKLLALPDRTMQNYISFGSLLKQTEFEKSEVPIDFADRIKTAKVYIKGIYKEAGEKFDRDVEEKLEMAIINRIKEGSITKRGEVTKFADIAREDLPGFKKLLSSTKVELNDVFNSSNASSWRTARGFIYNLNRIKFLTSKGMSLNIEKNLDKNDKQHILDVIEMLNSLAKSIK